MKRLSNTTLLTFAICIASVAPVSAQDRITDSIAEALHERRVAYRDALSKVVDVLQHRYLQGSDQIDGLIKAQIALGEAELRITSDPQRRIEVLKENLAKLRKMEEYQQGRLRIGMARTDELHKSTAGRIHGEIMLLEEQQRQSP